MFGPNHVFVELQRHNSRERGVSQPRGGEHCLGLSTCLCWLQGALGYALPEERETLDIFTCIRHRTSLDTSGRLLERTAQRYLHTAKQMQQLFYDYPEAIGKTVDLSARLQFDLSTVGYDFPPYQVPDDETMDSFLRKRVDEGIRLRYLPKNDSELFRKAKLQAEHELQVIERRGLAGYFLVVWDLVRFCKDNGVLAQGRGSAASSVVCYALEITIVEPVGRKLLFERFLSEERQRMPDIDIDTPSDKPREKVIQYLYGSYGEEGAAMTANVISIKNKSASREVGAAMGFDREMINKLSALLSAWEYKSPSDSLENTFKAAGLNMKDSRILHYLRKCHDLLRLPRNLGQHSGGMVVCQGHLSSIVPIERASMDGRTVVQWDKDDCSDMGIVKIDVLGLGMLAVLSDCRDLVPKYYSATLDYAQIPQDDAVYQSISEADTVGLFQIESRAQMSALPRTKPKCFTDLSMQVAIIRPGPVTGKFVNPYSARRLGREPITYLHPSFEPFVERTLGVPLFQEQVMRIGMVAANLTGGEAEELRKAMGGKRSDAVLAGLKVRLIEGMTANGFDSAQQTEVMREAFSQQCVSSCFLNHTRIRLRVSRTPAPTQSSITSPRISALYSTTNQWASIAHRRSSMTPNVTVFKMRPIDIQHSDWSCTLEALEPAERETYSGPFAVRVGLRYVRGLREDVGDAIVYARQTDGPFASEYDLKRRVCRRSASYELTLLAEGRTPFNWTGESTTAVPLFGERNGLGQDVGPLFMSIPDQFEIDLSAPLVRMKVNERLETDFFIAGFTLGPHPMTLRRAELDHLGVLRAAGAQGRAGRDVRSDCRCCHRATTSWHSRPDSSSSATKTKLVSPTPSLARNSMNKTRRP